MKQVRYENKKSTITFYFQKRALNVSAKLKNSLFNVHNPIGWKYLTRLRLNFSHLNEHKFHHNFRDTANPLCCCNTETLLSHRDDELLQICYMDCINLVLL